MKFTLRENQPYPVTVSGSWMWLKSAAQEIVLETPIGERVTVYKGSVVKNNELLGRVLLNSSVDQEIDIEFGKGDFQPPSDGQRVIIQEAPPLEIAEGQSIEVSAIPAVEFADGQSIEVSAIPAVEFAEGQHVTITVSQTLVALSGEMPLTLAANNQRRKVYIKANKENVDPIFIGGVYPLDAGEKIELETQAEITLTGTLGDSAVMLEY